MSIIFPKVNYPQVIIVSYGTEKGAAQISYLVPKDKEVQEDIVQYFDRVSLDKTEDMAGMYLAGYLGSKLEKCDFMDEEENINPALIIYSQDFPEFEQTSITFQMGDGYLFSKIESEYLPNKEGVVLITDSGSSNCDDHPIRQKLKAQLEKNKKIITKVPPQSSEFCEVNFGRAAYKLSYEMA